jgi:positive regulator of sigma E activity
MTQRVSPDRLRHHLGLVLDRDCLLESSAIAYLSNLVTFALCLALLLYTGRTV